MTSAPLAHTDVIVLDYLAALWADSEDLSPELRDELMTTVADYIAARRGSAAAPIEDPNAILRRLGPPESLVAAARRGYLPPHIRLPALVPPPPVPVRRTVTAGGAPEYAAVGLLTVGAFVLPGVGPAAGLLLATSSPYWSTPEKAVAWMLTAGSAAAGLMLALFVVTMSFADDAAVLLLYLATCAGAAVAGAQLLSHLRRRGQAG